MKPRTASVLSFHGGGYRGLFSAHVAAGLSSWRRNLTGSGDLRGCFDVFAGTSVGAILATALAHGGSSADDLVRLMIDHGERIFPRRPFLSQWMGVFAARFSSRPLQEVLETHLGDARLGDLDRVLVVPAVDETHGRAVVFRSHDPD